MKNLLLILLSFLIIFFHSNLLAQSEEELFVGELIIFFENRPSFWEITIKIEAQGAVWDHNHNLTNEYLGGDASYSQNSLLYRHSSGLSWGTYYMEPVLSLGLYEISIWEENNKKVWFYLDYRTAHLPFATTLQVPDILLNYDVINNTLDLFDPEIGYVLNGTYFPFWELKESCNHATAGLEDYWENALAAIPQKNPSTGVFEPFLSWGPNNEMSSPFDYQIYWRYGETGSFYLLKTVDVNTFTTRHENLEAIGGGSQVYYKVRAYNNQGPDYSDFTNIANLGVGQFYVGQDKKNLYENIGNNHHRLMQNYPNPFNP